MNYSSSNFKIKSHKMDKYTDVSKLASYDDLITKIKENKKGISAFNTKAAKRLVEMSKKDVEIHGGSPLSESYAKRRITLALQGKVDWIALEAMNTEIEPIMKMRKRISVNIDT